MPITMNPDGSVKVDSGTSASGGRTAAQDVYQGRQSSVSYTPTSGGGSVRYTGSGGGGGNQLPSMASATGGGAQYGGGGSQDSDYAQARAAYVQQQARQNEAAKRRRDEREGLTQRAEDESPAAIAGLDVASVAKAVNEEVSKPKQQKKKKAETTEAPIVAASETIAPTPTSQAKPVSTNEVTTTVTPEPEVVPAPTPAPEPEPKPTAKKKPAPRKRTATAKRGSKMAEAMEAIDKEVADGSRTQYIRPSDINASIDATLMNPDAVNRQLEGLGRFYDQMSDIHDQEVLANSLENWPEEIPLNLNRIWNEQRRNYQQEQERLYAEAEREAIEQEAAEAEQEEEERFEQRKPSEDLEDASWLIDQDLGDAKTQEEQLATIRKYDKKRTKRARRELLDNPETMRGLGFDDPGTGHRPWMESEDKIQRMFSKIRDLIVLRLISPVMLRIESEHVETITEGRGRNKVTRGRIRYSVEVENAIQNIRNLYKCSIRDVMKLVQLRGGIGVDSKRKIGGKKAKDFKLSDAQFIELCKDIERSQRMYGHPMALVNGIPGGNGVRDDSGKFVVVAGTRCYPLGYVPRSILNNLGRDPESPLHGRSIDETQQLIKNRWINDTYPNLLANATGNVLWQARAIENMMRAVMSIDGIDPSSLDIPDIKINRTLMQMAAESSQATDPDISRANEERERRERQAAERYRHRSMKENGGRTDKGVNSPSRRRNIGGDVLRGVSSWQKASKAADVFLLITSPLEAMQAMTTQHVGEWMLNKLFDARHAGVSANYQLTDRLSSAATSTNGIEARSVAEALYRIGGWAAIDAFVGELDGKHYKYKMTKADLRRFLDDYGVTNGSVSSNLLQRIGLDANMASSFSSNAQGVLNMLEGTMMGMSPLFAEKEAGQFAKLAMMEMARSSVRGGESYTSSQVEEWADHGGGEEMVRSLLRTEAGREAFMTQGVTGLGRKSPWDFALRQVMTRNGLTEALVRTCFDRFPEYGMNKIMMQTPGSNTISYLGSYAVEGIGRMMELVNEDAGQALQRAGQYQVGRRNGGFVDGLAKNMMYDSVMAVNRLMIGCVYFAFLQLMGGVHMPPKDEDEYTWSEWIIGDGPDALPLKWAWFMDDFSGVGLPLGMAFAIAQEGGWSPEARDRATITFLNAVANFNDGTALFDAIDLFNNFDTEMQEAMGNGETGAWLNPSEDEKRQTSLELMAWKFLGDMTPTIVKQVLPWSRDFLFKDREGRYARSASKVYDTPEYSMEDARREYRTSDVKDYHDYMMRREAQNNPIAAAIMDAIWGAGGDSEKTGYKFTEQPIRTEADPLASLMWDRYALDESVLPRDPEEKREVCRQWAEYICQEIDCNFKDPTDALSKGFILNPESRAACQEYCNWMRYEHIDEMKKAEVERLRDEMGMRYLPDDVYDNINQTYEDMKDHYKMLDQEYFSNKDMPSRLPRYAILDSDYETRYVDENGNAAANPALLMDPVIRNASRLLGIELEPGTAEQYPYGNMPNSLPAYSPQPTDLFNEESRPYWLRYDTEGNSLTDTQGIYDMLGSLGEVDIPEGMDPRLTEMLSQRADELGERALDTRSQLFGDRGRDAEPTLGKRGREPFEQLLPEGFKTYYDPEQASKILGFEAFDKSKKKDDEGTKSPSGNGYDGYGYGYDGYGRRSYTPYGGRSYGRSYGSGSGYSSPYNPKIYSNARNVNGTRASGLSLRQPYKATSTYLRPNFYTKGSREAYKRSDI